MRKTKKNIIILILLVGIKSALFAGIFEGGKGGRSAALGNASVTLADFWSVLNNQAGLASINNLSIGLYVENKFLLSSLSYKAVGILIPVTPGTIGITVIRFGDALFNETSIGISYGRQLSDQFSIGLQLFHYAVSQGRELGNAGKLSFQGGFIYKVDVKLRLGFHIFNPALFKKDASMIELATIIRFGIDYQLSNNLLGIIEFTGNSKSGNGLKAGFEYLSSEKIAIRLGYVSQLQKITFGVGFKLKKLSLDFSSSIHSILGYSPQISILYEL